MLSNFWKSIKNNSIAQNSNGQNNTIEIHIGKKEQMPHSGQIFVDEVVFDLQKSIGKLIKFLMQEENQTGQKVETNIQFPFSNMNQAQWIKTLELWIEYGSPLLEKVDSRKCPVCGEERHKPVFTSSDKYPFVNCLGCGTWYVPLMVDNNLFNEYFTICPEAKELTENMIQKRTKNPEDHDRARRLFELVAEVKDTLWSKPSFLDIGCGVGTFLAAGREKGYTCHGVDANPIMLNAARKRGLDVFQSLNELPDRKYDIITMLESLEHMVEPAVHISEACRRLSENGILVVTIPNQNSSMVRLMRDDCMHVFGGRTWPGHINLISFNGLKHLTRDQKLDVFYADCEYSHNIFELAGYLTGTYRGYFDQYMGQDNEILSPSTYSLLNNIAPYIAALERLCNVAPVIKVFFGHSQSMNTLTPFMDVLNNKKYREIIDGLGLE